MKHKRPPGFVVHRETLRLLELRLVVGGDSNATCPAADSTAACATGVILKNG